MSRILAIDFGHVRIGLAVSDPLCIFATSLENIKGAKDPKYAATVACKAIEELLKTRNWEISKVIVGLPLHLNGSESERSQEARLFAQTLESLLHGISVQLFDERMTSVQAERALIEANVSRKKRTHTIDGVSSTILLQSFLDFQARQTE
jgi:putative Holliday junction resolvase